MIVTESLIKDLVGVVVAIVVVVVAYFKWVHQYWKKKNLPYLDPSIPFGNIESPLVRRENFAMTMYKIYKTMKEKKWRHGGIFFFARPVYYILDPEYVKNIMTKDFHYFVDRGFYYNEKDDPLSAHLFALGGTKWRNLRTKLTPTFTSGKMKMMFPTIVECESGLQKRIQQESALNQPIDIKDILARFTTNVIGSCAFGLECNMFENEKAPFKKFGDRLIVVSKSEITKRFIALNFPNAARKIGFQVTPEDVAEFFTKLVTDTVKYREEKNVQRKDFMQLLIDLKNNKPIENEEYEHDGKSLTLDEITAQSVIFFVAGFETSSTTMAFALYELSKHQDIQDKLREEIKTVLARHNNEITYEAIQDMKYMDQVIDETLRKYPPVAALTRECVKDYKVPDADLVIDQGTLVLIPTYGLHYDADYFPDPEKFDPERFTEENKNSRHRYVYLPFGEGPRMCIGMRFGLMQSKVGLTALLRTHRFTVNEKTREPLKMRPDSFVLAVEGDIWLNAKKL